MNEIEKRNEIPSPSKLSKLGISAIGFTAGGVFLFILQAFSRIPLLGFAAGGIVTLLGIGSFLSKDPADKKAGAVVMTAGILVLLSKVPFAAPLASTLLSIGAFGLLALGIWNGIKFFLGLKKRSE